MSSVSNAMMVQRMGLRMVNGRWWLVGTNFFGIAVEVAKLYNVHLQRYRIPAGDHKTWEQSRKSSERQFRESLYIEIFQRRASKWLEIGLIVSKACLGATELSSLYFCVCDQKRHALCMTCCRKVQSVTGQQVRGAFALAPRLGPARKASPLMAS